MNDLDQVLDDLTNRRIDLANKYAIERKAYGKLKAEMDILFAAKILKLNEKKRNLGYETGLILLMAEGGEEVREMYKGMITHYNNFKAIERMIDAVESKVMTKQSLMRFYREQDGGL